MLIISITQDATMDILVPNRMVVDMSPKWGIDKILQLEALRMQESRRVMHFFTDVTQVRSEI
jgi:hypothetical protein